MVDLAGKDRGNISLPARLQSPDILDPNFVYDAEKFVPIINMQKALYDVRISDREKRIQRLEIRNSELSDEYEETEILINTIDLDTGDDIAYINRQISVESSKIEDIKRKINEISKHREEEKQTHEKNVELSNEKFENTRYRLTTAIKALNAKINTLDDYKQNRPALREKLKLGDETMLKKDEVIAQKQEAIIRKFKIDREKLKNEMYSRLLALAGTFQLEISDAIALPIHRLMRENIFIKAEMMKIVDEALSRKDNNMSTRSIETIHQNAITSNKLERRQNLITVKIQRCLLKAVKKMHSSIKKRLESFNKPEKFIQEIYDNLADSVRAELMIYEERTGKLEVLLHRESIKFESAKLMKNRTEHRAKIYEEILYDVKYSVACALKMTETGQDFLEMSESQLYSHLLNLFARGQSKIRCFAAASTESIARPAEVYVKGDLGFEPEHINFEGPEVVEKLAEEKSMGTIITADISAITTSVLAASSLESYQLEEAQFEITSAESSEFSDQISIEQPDEESSNSKEDISEAPDSIGHENEESSDDQLEMPEEEARLSVINPE